MMAFGERHFPSAPLLLQNVQRMLAHGGGRAGQIPATGMLMTSTSDMWHRGAQVHLQLGCKLPPSTCVLTWYKVGELGPGALPRLSFPWALYISRNFLGFIFRVLHSTFGPSPETEVSSGPSTDSPIISSLALKTASSPFRKPRDTVD